MGLRTRPSASLCTWYSLVLLACFQKSQHQSTKMPELHDWVPTPSTGGHHHKQHVSGSYLVSASPTEIAAISFTLSKSGSSLALCWRGKPFWITWNKDSDTAGKYPLKSPVLYWERTAAGSKEQELPPLLCSCSPPAQRIDVVSFWCLVCYSKAQFWKKGVKMIKKEWQKSK